MRSLGWTLLLLFLVMFIFAVYMVTTIAYHISQGGSTQLHDLHFGSLLAAMLVLFQAITGGIDWITITDQLQDISLPLTCAFVLYICFVMFAVLNIMTGFFVEQAVSCAETDVERVISEEVDERDRVAKNLQNVFREADKAGCGTITWTQLMDHLEDPTVQAYFKTLHLELWDIRTFFDITNDGSEDDPAGISIDQFVRCCLRLKGPAKNVDVLVLRHHMEKLQFEWQRLLKEKLGGRGSGEGSPKP